MEKRQLGDTDWSPRPVLPPALALVAVLVVIGIGTVLIYDLGLGRGTSNGLRVALYVGAFMTASGVVAVSRGLAKARSVGRLTCDDEGLRIGRRVIPYRSIRTIRFTAPETGDETELEIHVFRRFFPLRFVALDTVVEDLLMGLDRVDKENPQALVAPHMPRELKPL